MRSTFLFFFIYSCCANPHHGKYKQYINNARKPDYFKKENALNKFKEFKNHAQNMTKGPNRGQTDLERENIKRGFELFNNYTKITDDKLNTNTEIAKEAVETLGYILNKDVLEESKRALPFGERKEFDKSISKEGAKSRREFAKLL